MSHAQGPAGEGERERLRAVLAEARASLARALEGLTEREFAADIGGESALEALARLPQEEREAVRAGAALMGMPFPLGLGPADAARRERLVPPQVVHDLAGARRLTLELLAAAPPSDVARLSSVVEGVAERERSVAERLGRLHPVGRSGSVPQP